MMRKKKSNKPCLSAWGVKSYTYWGSKWQHLPTRHAGSDEPVDECSSLCPELADAVGTGQRRGVKDDTGATLALTPLGHVRVVCLHSVLLIPSEDGNHIENLRRRFDCM